MHSALNICSGNVPKQLVSVVATEGRVSTSNTQKALGVDLVVDKKENRRLYGHSGRSKIC